MPEVTPCLIGSCSMMACAPLRCAVGQAFVVRHNSEHLGGLLQFYGRAFVNDAEGSSHNPSRRASPE
eukprot:12822537-Prorocentrum_lima.AAC.1